MRKLPAKLASQLYGAAELIAERGLDGTKIEDIAEATGIPKATIYYHLDGKNAVLEFLLGDLLDMIAGAVGVAVASEENARTRLEAAVQAQLGVMLEHPSLCRALVGDLGRATRLPELAAALRTAFYEPIEQLLAEGVSDGSLRQVADPGAVALSVFGAITVAGLSAAVEGPSADPSADAARFSAAITELVLEAMGAAWDSVQPVEDRKGHDRRYSVDDSRLRAMGYEPQHAFADGLAETIAWYRANEAWWRPLKVKAAI